MEGIILQVIRVERVNKIVVVTLFTCSGLKQNNLIIRSEFKMLKLVSILHISLGLGILVKSELH